MVSKEMRKLSRRELVDVIYQLKKNEEQLQEQIAALQETVDEKRIRVSVAGSIAEAAMDITQIFATAQTTADLYLQEIACRKAETEVQCAQMLEEAKQEAEKILAEARQKAEELTNTVSHEETENVEEKGN